jgi:hypothetical protein
MKTLPPKVRAFVETAPLPKPRSSPARGAVTKDITPPVSVGNTSAVVVGPQVTGFMDGVDPTMRGTVTQSMLLASLVAQQSSGGGPEKVDWYIAYENALRSQGWSLGAEQQRSYDAQSKKLDVHEAVIDFITAVGVGGPAYLLVVAALNAMKKVGDNQPWITLFDRETHVESVAGFNVAVVSDSSPQTSDGNGVSMQLSNFNLHGSTALTQVLFLKFQETKLTIAANGVACGISHDQLTALQMPLRERLSAYVTDFIANVKLPPAQPK